MFGSDNGENVTFKSETIPFGFLHSYVTQLEAWMSFIGVRELFCGFTSKSVSVS